MNPKLFIFGVCMLLTYRTIEGQNVDGDEFSSETTQTGLPSDESSTETNINVNQSTEYQYVENPDADVSESLGRKPVKNTNIVKPNTKSPLHPNPRPSPNPNHRPSRPPPIPPTRPPRKPSTRPSPTPPTRPPHAVPTRPSHTPTPRYRPDKHSTPIVTQKPNTPSQTPKPNTPESTTHSVTPKPESTTHHGQTSPLTTESTTHSPYQTTPGYNAGIFTSTQHFTDKVNGWLNVASGASDQLNREVSKWKTLITTPYNVGSADVTPETPTDGSAVDETHGSDDAESSTTDSTPVDDWTPVLPDVTEPNSTDIPTNVDETSATSDISKVDETTSVMEQTPELV